MDGQLACATFATVIPVLLLAGYFSADMELDLGFVRAWVWVVAVLSCIGELVALHGTGSTHPSEWHVVIAELGAVPPAGGLFGAMFLRLLVAGRAQKRKKEHEDRSSDPG